MEVLKPTRARRDTSNSRLSSAVQYSSLGKTSGRSSSRRSRSNRGNGVENSSSEKNTQTRVSNKNSSSKRRDNGVPLQPGGLVINVRSCTPPIRQTKQDAIRDNRAIISYGPSPYESDATSAPSEPRKMRCNSFSSVHSQSSIGSKPQSSFISTISAVMDKAVQGEGYRNARSRSSSPFRRVGSHSSFSCYQTQHQAPQPTTPRSMSTRSAVRSESVSRSESRSIASSYFSAAVSSFLNTIMPKNETELLREFILTKKWDEVKKLSSTSQGGEVTPTPQTDHDATLLGLACSMNAPVDVIKILLLREPTATSTHDEKLNYPLHHVCQNGTSMKVLKTILNHNRDAMHEQNILGKTPILLAIERGVPSKWLELLIDTAPDATSIADNTGCLPIHYCLKSSSDLQIIKKLLHVYPEAVTKVDEQGGPPVYYAVCWGAPFEVLHLLASTCPAMVKTKVGDQCSIIAAWNRFISPFYAHEGDEQKLRKSNWRKIDLLLKAACHNTTDDPLPKGRKWLVVHAIVSAYFELSDMLKAAIAMYPKQVRTKGEHGQLPLHIATAAQPTYKKEEITSTLLLLDAYPGAANMRDQKGRLPLHYALDTGRTWHTGIQQIFDANPTAISVRDPKTGLYPFMIPALANISKIKAEDQNRYFEAAKERFTSLEWERCTYVAKKQFYSEVRECDEREEVGTVFELLRKAPQLVMCGVKFVPDDNETVGLRIKNMELRRKKKSLRRALSKMCSEFDRVNTNHSLRRAELELEIARLTQKLSVIRNIDVTKADEHFEVSSSDLGGRSTPKCSMLKTIKDPRKKYRKVKVKFAS